MWRPILPFVFVVMAHALAPQKTPLFQTQTSLGRIEIRTTNGTVSVESYSYYVDTSKKVMRVETNKGLQNQTTTWIMANGTFSLMSNLCYYTGSMNYTSVTTGQYKVDLAFVGAMKWSDWPDAPTWDTYFGPVSNKNLPGQLGIVELWDSEGLYRGAIEVSTNAALGILGLIFDDVTSAVPPAADMMLHPSCHNAQVVSGQSADEKIKTHLKTKAKHLVNLDEPKTIELKDGAEEREEFGLQNRASGRPSRIQRRDHAVSQLALPTTPFLPANKPVLIAAEFNISGQMTIRPTKLVKPDSTYSIGWAASSKAKKMWRAKSYGTNNVTYAYIQADGSFHPSGKSGCMFNSEGGYEAETDDYDSSEWFYMGKVGYPDPKVGDVSCWAFIGPADPDADTSIVPPQIGFMFTDDKGVPKALLEPNSLTAGGAIERIFAVTDNKIDEGAFEPPKACLDLKDSPCDDAAMKKVSACQLQLLMSSVFVDQPCSYLAKARKCYGDAMCKTAVTDLCGTTTAAPCGLKFCP